VLKLIIEDDEGRKTVVPFSRDEITIGRQEGNTIRLTERNVSRHHARLVRQNGHVLVEDLGSYTGVLINGERIQGQVQVGDGDHIQIGDYDLALQREASKQPGPPTVRVPTVAPAPDPDVTAEFKTETNLPIPGDSEGEGPPTPAMSQGAQVEMNRPRRASKSRVFALGAVVLLGVGAAWLLFGQPPASPPPPRQPVMAEKPPEPPRATQAARVQDPATSTGTQPSDTTEQPAEKPPLADSHIEAMPSTGTTHRATVEQARQLHHEGVMLIRKQQLPEAESVLKKCITLKPTYAPCHLALGSAAARRNRPEESTQYYREFLRLAPNHEMAPSVRKLVADHDKSQKQPGGGK
jgi:pSer/pThr/pTyr-binding forkhead associated (FHA) protein